VEQPPSDRGSAVLPRPASILRAPITAGLEWRLASASGRIVHVERDGDSWRADLGLPNGGTIPVRAGPASGVDPARVTQGASAEVTGIVRRAHPQASDQRFGLVPRSLADFRLGSVADPGAGSGSGSGSGGDPAPGGGGGAAGGGGSTSDATPAAVAGSSAPEPADAAIGDLARFEGRLVRVGGRVRTVSPTRLELEDGTGRAGARFPAAAERLLAAVTPGEVVNVIGLVGRADRQWLVEARTGTDLARLGAPASPAPRLASRHPFRSASPAPVGLSTASGPPAPSAGPPLPVVVLVVVLLLAAVFLVVGVVARRRMGVSLGLRPLPGLGPHAEAAAHPEEPCGRLLRTPGPARQPSMSCPGGARQRS
jgi:hypothetical protein